MADSYYHEPPEELGPEVRDVARALQTTIEELEAVNWYHQRAAVCADEELRDVLIHHRDEEIEHAAMGLEWLRRRIPKFDEELRTYLFTDAPVAEVEEGAEGEGNGGDDADAGGLGLGKFTK